MALWRRGSDRAETGLAGEFCTASLQCRILGPNLTVDRILAVGVLAVITLLSMCSLAYADTVASGVQSPNVAFFYQHDLPVDELQAFDAVVIDPVQSVLPSPDQAPHTFWFARLNLRGLTDLSLQDVNKFVLQQIEPLWRKGYRGFFLDDGTVLDDKTVAQGDERMGSVLKAIRVAYPESRLMLRNHLALAQANADGLYAVVVDSLYQRSAGNSGFLPVVPQALRLDVLKQIKGIQAHAHLPVVAIDYCAVGDQKCRRSTAHRLINDGVIPFVTSPGMGTVGLGRIEVMPRKILMIQAVGNGQPLDQTAGVHSIAMPLNYLGYDVRYVDINRPLPDHITNDRYAGIVVSIDRPVSNSGAWRQWLLARIREGMRVAVFSQFGFPMDAQTGRALNLDVPPGAAPLSGTPQVVSKATMMGFEIMPSPDIRDAVGIRVGASGQSLLRLQTGSYIYDAAALTPWGGYVLDPYAVVSLGSIDQDRWVIQPIDFLKQALALPDMPVPDVTTENGRRLMFTHVDGDGFASRAEFSSAANEYSGQVLYNQIFTKYQIPMTVSVIEGEVASTGMYPQLTSKLEPIARKIFALPNVEIGSHTYSHPFNLEQVDDVTGKRVGGKPDPEWGGDDAFSLEIPNYVFNIDREIQGSIDYINRRLAPPGKSVVALLWPGDAAAPKIALRRAARAGVFNINGGDTVITKANNSWTNIAPYGVAKGDSPDEYQVYASTMNENVFTNDWEGPFYGFDRVLETFAMTDKPIRFKALDIYYHFYSGTKTASLKALHTIFDTVLKQPVVPIYTTEYIKRVLDWRHVVVAREGNRWMVRSGSSLRELRWPGQGVPDLSTADGVSGYFSGSSGLYIHMGTDNVSFAISPKSENKLPYITEASGFVRNFQRIGNGLEFEFGGYYKPFVQLANVARCRSTVDGKPVKAVANAEMLKLNVSGLAAKPISYHLVKVNCG